MYYSVRRLAKRFEVHPETIRRAVWRGLLEGSKVGRDWKFSEEQVGDYLKRVGYKSVGEEVSNG